MKIKFLEKCSVINEDPTKWNCYIHALKNEVIETDEKEGIYLINLSVAEQVDEATPVSVALDYTPIISEEKDVDNPYASELKEVITSNREETPKKRGRKPKVKEEI